MMADWMKHQIRNTAYVFHLMFARATGKPNWLTKVPKQFNFVHYYQNSQGNLPTVTNMPENAIPLARISKERTSTG